MARKKKETFDFVDKDKTEEDEEGGNELETPTKTFVVTDIDSKREHIKIDWDRYVEKDDTLHLWKGGTEVHIIDGEWDKVDFFDEKGNFIKGVYNKKYNK